MIELKFSAASHTELRAAIRDYLGLDAEAGPQPGADAPAAERQTRARKASAGAASADTAKTTGSDTVEEPDAPAELSYDSDIKPLILKVSKDIGEDEARSLLAAYKGADGKPCAGGKAIQPKDYANFKRTAEKLLDDKAKPVEEDELA